MYIKKGLFSLEGGKCRRLSSPFSPRRISNFSATNREQEKELKRAGWRANWVCKGKGEYTAGWVITQSGQKFHGGCCCAQTPRRDNKILPNWLWRANCSSLPDFLPVILLTDLKVMWNKILSFQSSSVDSCNIQINEFNIFIKSQISNSYLKRRISGSIICITL